MSLGGVLEHEQAMATRQGVDPLHLARLPVQVHGKDGRSARTDDAYRGIGIDQPSVSLHVTEHRGGAGVQDAQSGGDERVPRKHHLVTSADSSGDESQGQSGGA